MPARQEIIDVEGRKIALSNLDKVLYSAVRQSDCRPDAGAPSQFYRVENGDGMISRSYRKVGFGASQIPEIQFNQEFGPVAVRISC